MLVLATTLGGFISEDATVLFVFRGGNFSLLSTAVEFFIEGVFTEGI